MSASKYRPRKLRLKNGLQVYVRQIAPHDKPLIKKGFEQLSPETIRMRFMGLRKGFSEEELNFLTDIDGVDHFALGVSNLEQTEGIAVARYIRDSAELDTAELAIVIVDRYQRLGLGSQLINEITKYAMKHGVRCFKGHLSPDNEAMKNLISQFNREVFSDGTFLIRL